jgi:ADP-ribose pyrophosphatase YjhB (NUDIX family)
VSGSAGGGDGRPRAGLRPRYVHRVTRDDVGERVSVRVRDDEAARDVVGRLLSADDELLLVLTRDGELEVLPTDAVLASRVVPPHPRRPREPAVGTRDAPLVRASGRALVLDPDDRVLLVSHLPGDGRRIWTAPGGGVRPGEDHAAAARRELREEVGIDLEPGPPVWTRRVTFAFRDAWIDQAERWLLVRLERAVDLADAPLVDPGIDHARWWTLDELRTTDETLAPRAFAEHLARLLRDGPPDEPTDVGR